MLDQSSRTAILKLHEEGHGTRAIAHALNVSRNAVKAVLSDGLCAPPPLARAQKADPHREQIVDLIERCQGNLVRVHEELLVAGAQLSYQALTAFCRKHHLSGEPEPPTGRYHFVPGQEMQHDTSPHDAKLDGRMRRMQTASVVLCYSRMIFMQHYPRFDRFTCKLFLTDAVRYFGGACGVCMIDNTHVIVSSGTGKEMVPAPEMAAFAERLRFEFRAHERGDANRSARVERPFHYIENNFLAGREFSDWAELNREALIWCDKVNAKYRKHLRAVPRDLFATEKPHLKPQPIWIPDPYALHHRVVDTEGYVTVHRNRYSTPWRLIGRQVEVRETKERIEIFDGPRRIADHERVVEALDARVLDPAHHPRREPRTTSSERSIEEKELQRIAPELGDYVVQIKRQAGVRGVRRLLRMVADYPRAPLIETVRVATHYGLFDLDRVERMVLRGLQRDFFLVSNTPVPTDGDGDDEPEPEDPDDG